MKGGEKKTQRTHAKIQRNLKYHPTLTTSEILLRSISLVHHNDISSSCRCTDFDHIESLHVANKHLLLYHQLRLTANHSDGAGLSLLGLEGAPKRFSASAEVLLDPAHGKKDE